MKKPTSKNHKKHGNENSYTKEFFEALYKKITPKDQITKTNLERAIILAAQSYI